MDKLLRRKSVQSVVDAEVLPADTLFHGQLWEAERRGAHPGSMLRHVLPSSRRGWEGGAGAAARGGAGQRGATGVGRQLHRGRGLVAAVLLQRHRLVQPAAAAARHARVAVGGHTGCLAGQGGGGGGAAGAAAAPGGGQAGQALLPGVLQQRREGGMLGWGVSGLCTLHASLASICHATGTSRTLAFAALCLALPLPIAPPAARDRVIPGSRRRRRPPGLSHLGATQEQASRRRVYVACSDASTFQSTPAHLLSSLSLLQMIHVCRLYCTPRLYW